MEFGERNRPNPGSAGSEFRERTWPNLDSEFGFGVRRKERAEPWFGRFGRFRVFFFFFSHFFFIFFHLFFRFFFLFFFSFLFFFLIFFSYLFRLFFIIFSFFFHFFSFFFSFFILFFGVRRKEPVFLQTPNLPNQGWDQFFLRTQYLPNQGSAQFLLRTRNLPGFGGRRKELAFLRTPNLPNQDSTCSFSELGTCPTRVIRVLSPNSELKLRTPGKNTVNPGPSWKSDSNHGA